MGNVFFMSSMIGFSSLVFMLKFQNLPWDSFILKLCLCFVRRIILSMCRVVFVWRVGGCLCLFLIVIVWGCVVCRANVHVCVVCCVLRMGVCVSCEFK